MESLRLAFVADRCEPYYSGGYEHHMWELARRLARHHEVCIFSSMPRHGSSIQGVQFRKSSPYLSYTGFRGGHSPLQASIYALTSSIWIPDLKRFDFVDVLGIPYIHLPILRLRGLLAGRPWGITVWEAWTDYSFWPGPLSPVSRFAFRALLRLGLQGRHRVIAGSRTVAQALQSSYRVASERIRVISPGIDSGLVESARPSAQQTDVVFLGRLDPFKRVSDLIYAVRLLKERGRKVSLAIIGEGVEKPRLAGLASSLGVVPEVQLLGWLPKVEVYSRLKSSSLFVLPSDREGFSIATLEAMACGVAPIVAKPQDAGAFGVADLVIDGRTGRLYPARDVNALAGLINRLLEDFKTRTALATRARAHARSFDWEIQRGKYEQLVLEGRDVLGPLSMESPF